MCFTLLYNDSLQPRFSLYRVHEVLQSKNFYDVTLHGVGLWVLYKCIFTPLEPPTVKYYNIYVTLDHKTSHKQCWGKLLLKVMHYNIALLPKKVTNYVTLLLF